MTMPGVESGQFIFILNSLGGGSFISPGVKRALTVKMLFCCLWQEKLIPGISGNEIFKKKVIIDDETHKRQEAVEKNERRRGAHEMTKRNKPWLQRGQGQARGKRK
eukprot:TRINITY_DN3146_c0_g1_i2.p2 TRINITY_DN3146_c0_g1~~TRINITY_DN3146_c0_g1_i2.p2  ORF type:complete len:106 (+),score=10.43 TRINITY_DN3146_c0_g1_i2:219-536(+)